VTLQEKLFDNAQTVSIATFLADCIIFFGLTGEAFLSLGNMLNLLRQAAPMLIVAVAMTFVITTGGIDLSVG
jgi:simple sugar transport system permease protein